MTRLFATAPLLLTALLLTLFVSPSLAAEPAEDPSLEDLSPKASTPPLGWEDPILAEFKAKAKAEKRNIHRTTETLNVKEFGALGDGKTDDTRAFQRVFWLYSSYIGTEIYLPPGKYLISETLAFRKREGIVIRGSNGTAWGKSRANAEMIWAGKKGGNLLEFYGCGHLRLEHVKLTGMKNKQAPRAGRLLGIASEKGFGSMMHSFTNVHFSNADIGVQFGAIGKIDICNSDCSFLYTSFMDLGKAVLATNHQAVDFLFNFVFGVRCGTVFDFQRGGNLNVNNSQLTDCDLLLDVGFGGVCNGTYLFTNARIEAGKGGWTNLPRAVRAYPRDSALIKFVNFSDILHAWRKNKRAHRTRPMFEVGPKCTVIVESSLFASPVALVKGIKGRMANFIVRDSVFWAQKPEAAVTANEFGNVKLINNMSRTMVPYPDFIKWPEKNAIRVDASSVHQGVPQPIPAEPQAP